MAKVPTLEERMMSDHFGRGLLTFWCCTHRSDFAVEQIIWNVPELKEWKVNVISAATYFRTSKIRLKNCLTYARLQRGFLDTMMFASFSTVVNRRSIGQPRCLHSGLEIICWNRKQTGKGRSYRFLANMEMWHSSVLVNFSLRWHLGNLSSHASANATKLSYFTGRFHVLMQLCENWV